jgi:hypothetical protein
MVNFDSRDLNASRREEGEGSRHRRQASVNSSVNQASAKMVQAKFRIEFENSLQEAYRQA